MTRTDHYHRSVSDNEQLYIHMQELFSTLAIHLVVEGSGHIDPIELQIAVEKASEACPGARLIQSGGQWVDSQCTPPVHLLTGSNFDGKDFSKIELLEKKMDPENGPTSEVIILQLDPAILVFRVFHGTMDGKAVILWINHIFRALRGDALVPIIENETDLSFLKRHQHHTQKNRLYFDISTLEQRYSIKNFKVWRERITLPERPGCLVARIAETITAHGVSYKNRFLIPVDIRRHQKTHLSNANLTLPIFLETTKDDHWADIHKNLLTDLQNNREMNLNSADLGLLVKIPQMLFKLGLRSLLTFQNWMEKQLCGAVISDLGMIDLDELTTPHFQANTLYSLTVQQPFIPFAIAIASNKHGTEIMISCYENETLISHAKKMINSLKNELSSVHALEKINAAPKIYPHHKTVIHLIEEQIVKTPHTIAIQSANKAISYADLGHQIDQMAAILLSNGIKPGHLVAILMRRNEWLLPSILAVMKAGAIFVPIEHELPKERLNKLLKRSNISFCITEELLKDHLDLSNDCKIIVADPCKPNCTEINFCLAKSDQIAYQMYTSGSTGVPKGVQIEHCSLVNYLLWAQKEYQVDEKSCFPLFASIAFDSTMTAMFLPLISGGSIELFEDAVSHLTFRKIIESQTISHIKLSPAHLQLAVKPEYNPGSPKTLIVGGEQLSLQLARKTHDLYGDHWKVINEYGPTEATIGCITHTYHPHHQYADHAVPIGRPIMNTKIYLFDEHHRSVEEGRVGEIYIAGDCLARGYADDPILTAQKFVTLDQGVRAYKTGDLAYLNEDDDLVYLGRTDHQISINGYRIEPGEIENAILEFKGINEVAVVSKNTPAGRNLLTAFYTAPDRIDEASLKKHLEHHLPSYMQVHFFVRIDTMPLTSNHKIDKQALQIPELPKEQNIFEAASSQEQQLIEIWREVLELSEDYPINVDDNFFELGGDSLAMLAVLEATTHTLLGEKLEKTFMSKMSAIIKSPTIKTFSKIISALKNEQ